MNIIQKGRTNDGTEFKTGDVLRIETQEHGQHFSYTGVFEAFYRTYWFKRPGLILSITDNTDAEMKIRFFEIQKITKYAEAQNDRKPART